MQMGKKIKHLNYHIWYKTFTYLNTLYVYVINHPFKRKYKASFNRIYLIVKERFVRNFILENSLINCELFCLFALFKYFRNKFIYIILLQYNQFKYQNYIIILSNLLTRKVSKINESIQQLN